MRKKRWLILLILVVLAAGGFYALRNRGRSTTLEVWLEQVRQPTMPVSRGTLRKTISASGTIRGARQADLGFTVGGRIERILVEVGQAVAEGELLAEMDSTQQELALLRAQNAYELAKISGTPNALREAELDLKLAQTNLANTKIQAPFAGVVTAVNFQAGEQVSANNPVVSLLDNSVFYVEIAVDELDVHQIRQGQLALVEVDALPGVPFTGTVDSIGLIAHSSGGITTVPVTIRLAENTAELRVGYSASVTIEVARAEDVLKVPVEAVVVQGNRSFVTVVRDGETRPVEVQTGLSDGLEVEIISGLEPGDQIVGFNVALYGGPGQTAGFRLPSAVPGVRIGGFGR